MLDVTLFSSFRQKLSKMSTSTRQYGHYFKALALADSYNYLIHLVDERTARHPEVVRVPEMRTLLINNLVRNAQKHISLADETIFNPLLIGTDMLVRQWQEAGYYTRRTAKNYQRRLDYWKSIYDEQPIHVPILRSKKKHVPKPRAGEDIFNSAAEKKPEQLSLFYEIRVKDRTGNIVTYEDIIRKRNAAFGSSNYIPYWIVLNYGSDRGSQPGYPSVGGLHFVEDAERTIPINLSKYSDLFSRFMLFLLDNEDVSKDFTSVEAWAAEHIKTQATYINSFHTALELVYGLPF